MPLLDTLVLDNLEARILAADLKKRGISRVALLADDTLKRATDMTIQSHSIDPPHPYILRSIELMAEKVAPALGWAPERDSGERRVA